MSKFTVAFSLAAFLLSAAVGVADDSGPAASAVNLDGSIYMGIIPVGDEGPDPNADSRLPFYFAFGQEGNSLYGCLVIADTDKLGAPPALAVDISLTQMALADGKISGDEFTARLIDETGKEVEFGIKGKIRGAGEQIDIYMTSSTLEVGPFYIYRCNEAGEFYSGIYVGKGNYTSTPSAAAPNNILVGILVRESGKLAFASLLYDPADPGERYNFFGEADDFDPETGVFIFKGDKLQGEPDVDGFIGGGVMDLLVNGVDGRKAEATLYFFETEHKKMRLKKPAPRKAAKGKDTTIKLKHRFALRGAHVSQNNPDVRINWYRYHSKYFLINLDVDSKASGKVKFTVTSPGGRRVAAKKQIVIK